MIRHERTLRAGATATAVVACAAVGGTLFLACASTAAARDRRGSRIGEASAAGTCVPRRVPVAMQRTGSPQAPRTVMSLETRRSRP